MINDEEVMEVHARDNDGGGMNEVDARADAAGMKKKEEEGPSSAMLLSLLLVLLMVL